MLDDFSRQLGLERTFLQVEPETQPLTLLTQSVGNGHTWYYEILRRTASDHLEKLRETTDQLRVMPEHFAHTS